MIVRVFGDGPPTDVPVTPDTTSSDVIECCRDPGEESCNLVAVCPDHGDLKKPLNVTFKYDLDMSLATSFQVVSRWSQGQIN
ncbi:hypothetical protein HHI36_009533 [Cryptolaemus montrouzieri]|uniref:Apoptosis-stimulating of p53 protein 2-like RA domain-containing protein n=1 Tax=Cryptolaemus montrouzieri TaxID=559131 RepID=A0ABD2MG36_9CUCU